MQLDIAYRYPDRVHLARTCIVLVNTVRREATQSSWLYANNEEKRGSVPTEGAHNPY